ncbi:arylsulfatase [Thalassotalea fonticola]|uniref:Arylsulfatase n=1 Tax=Thalassotalea fonticola TaxID=3065649 RepID=A0ABZ0GMH4_9GAMM|nr:arylsulfatase [Colwelliaceae bacterium S1-1]
MKTLTALSTIAACLLSVSACADNKATQAPNIIYILADDLGYSELGAYGQTKIKTPNIDNLAKEGIQFTQHYSGSAVCAPSRSTFIEGKHSGNAHVRGNTGDGNKGRMRGNHPLPDTRTIADMFKEQGYATAAIGKWGLGGMVGTGHPNDHGFDLFYGYLDQRHAHNYYPTYLVKNREFVELDNPEMIKKGNVKSDAVNDPKSYAAFKGKEFSGDLMADEAINFINSNAKADKPFFLYFPTPIPHAALQLPEQALAKYDGAFDETPYIGNKGYFPHQTPRAAYAGMVTLLDDYVGQMLAALKKNGIEDNTLIIFTSDNGPTFNGGSDSEFFESAKPFRGVKMDLYEGGIRAPFIAYWKGKILPGQSSDLISAQYDMMATFADLIGVKANEDTDGISIAPTLLGKGEQQQHEYLLWEYPEKGGQQAIRMGKWKGIRTNLKQDPNAPIQLFDLSTDISENNDVASKHPDVVAKIKAALTNRSPASLERWDFDGYKVKNDASE